MSELLQVFLSAFGGAAVAVAAIGWLCRTLIRHQLTKDLETHKLRVQADLEATGQRTILELEASLRFTEMRLSKLQERRFGVLESLYKKMVDMFQDAATFFSPAEFEGGPTKDDLRKKLGESLSAFLQFYGHHKIFFSPDVVTKIDELVRSVRKPAMHFSVYITAAEKSDLAKGKMVDAWIKAGDDFDELAGPALQAVEAQFRSLLGVSELHPAPGAVRNGA